MNKLFIAVVLGMLPVLSFILQYYFSKREKILNKFKNHFICYYLDWLLVPFGIIWPYVVHVSGGIIFLALGLSFILSIATHAFWYFLGKKDGERSYIFDFENRKLTGAGIVHFFFSIIEYAAVGLFLLFSTKSLLSVISGIILIVFILGLIPGSKRIHGKITLSDALIVILGALIILIKLLI
jgi:hypothetical protein